MPLGMLAVLPEILLPALFVWVVPAAPFCRSLAQPLNAKSAKVLALLVLLP